VPWSGEERIAELAQPRTRTHASHLARDTRGSDGGHDDYHVIPATTSQRLVHLFLQDGDDVVLPGSDNPNCELTRRVFCSISGNDDAMFSAPGEFSVVKIRHVASRIVLHG
jgi:hypothetical protein